MNFRRISLNRQSIAWKFLKLHLGIKSRYFLRTTLGKIFYCAKFISNIPWRLPSFHSDSDHVSLSAKWKKFHKNFLHCFFSHILRIEKDEKLIRKIMGKSHETSAIKNVERRRLCKYFPRLKTWQNWKLQLEGERRTMETGKRTENVENSSMSLAMHCDLRG